MFFSHNHDTECGLGLKKWGQKSPLDVWVVTQDTVHVTVVLTAPRGSVASLLFCAVPYGYKYYGGLKIELLGVFGDLHIYPLPHHINMKGCWDCIQCFHDVRLHTFYPSHVMMRVHQEWRGGVSSPGTLNPSGFFHVIHKVSLLTLRTHYSITKRSVRNVRQKSQLCLHTAGKQH